jgi:FlaA1/EpsC-like NDP-sugar epimerase
MEANATEAVKNNVLGSLTLGELQYSDEAIDKTRHPKIFIGKIAGGPAAELDSALASLRALAPSGPSDEIRAFLGAFLPEAQLNGGVGAPGAVGGSLGT